jgi:ABC-type multidrug transport system fused ATPase/permease subunit
MNKNIAGGGIRLIFGAVLVLIGLFLSAVVSVVAVYLIDFIFNKSPQMSYLAQKPYNRDIMERVGWEVFFGVFILTFILLTIYFYIKVFKEPRKP